MVSLYGCGLLWLGGGIVQAYRVCMVGLAAGEGITCGMGEGM